MNNFELYVLVRETQICTHFFLRKKCNINVLPKLRPPQEKKHAHPYIIQMRNNKLVFLHKALLCRRPYLLENASMDKTKVLSYYTGGGGHDHSFALFSRAYSFFILHIRKVEKYVMHRWWWWDVDIRFCTLSRWFLSDRV